MISPPQSPIMIPTASPTAGPDAVPAGSVTPASRHSAAREFADHVSLLRSVPLFLGLRADELAPLAEACRRVTFAAGDTVVQQDKLGDCVYIILDGRVEVRARAKSPGAVSETVLSWLVEGDTVGELSLFDGRPRSASCVALADTTCLRLDRDAFLAAARSNWDLTLAVFGVLSDRIRHADTLLAEHARDALTGVNNRRALIELYEREATRAQRAARQAVAAGSELAANELVLVFVDVDKFKSINDTFGHHVGDEVLRSVANTLVTAGRSTDFVACYGGDEFVMLLPEAGLSGADLVVSRIRELVHDEPPGPVPFTVSIGAALIDPLRPETFVDVMARADAAMYRDKARTR